MTSTLAEPIAPVFTPFPKMPRLSRECLVTEKIDGTNASVLIRPSEFSFCDDDLPVAFVDTGTDQFDVFAGSRNRWITEMADNHGFARWVAANAEELVAKLGPGHHFGEYWGSGIQRGYGLPQGEKRFSLFNVSRWHQAGEEPKQIPQPDTRVVKHTQELPACCHLVPVLYRGVFDTAMIEGVLTLLGATGSKASPGFMNPEGIVVYHVAGNMGFKKTLANDGIPKSKVPNE